MAERDSCVVGVFFGGRSVEHDVSVVTGQQVMRALEEGGHQVVPIYIDRGGGMLQWCATAGAGEFRA